MQSARFVFSNDKYLALLCCEIKKLTKLLGNILAKNITLTLLDIYNTGNHKYSFISSFEGNNALIVFMFLGFFFRSYTCWFGLYTCKKFLICTEFTCHEQILLSKTREEDS